MSAESFQNLEVGLYINASIIKLIIGMHFHVRKFYCNLIKVENTFISFIQNSGI